MQKYTIVARHCTLCVFVLNGKFFVVEMQKVSKGGNIIKSSRTVENNPVCVLFLILDTFFNSTSYYSRVEHGNVLFHLVSFIS